MVVIRGLALFVFSEAYTCGALEGGNWVGKPLPFHVSLPKVTREAEREEGGHTHVCTHTHARTHTLIQTQPCPNQSPPPTPGAKPKQPVWDMDGRGGRVRVPAPCTDKVGSGLMTTREPSRKQVCIWTAASPCVCVRVGANVQNCKPATTRQWSV